MGMIVEPIRGSGVQQVLLHLSTRQVLKRFWWDDVPLGAGSVVSSVILRCSVPDKTFLFSEFHFPSFAQISKSNHRPIQLPPLDVYNQRQPYLNSLHFLTLLSFMVLRKQNDVASCKPPKT